MAKAVKKVVKRRRERKTIEKGAVHIRSSFNNTMVTVTDANGNALSRWSRLPRQQKVHAVRRADGRRDRCKGSCGKLWSEDCRSLRQGPRPGP